MSTAPTIPRFTRHINDAFPEYDVLFSAGDAIVSLLEHPGWAAVQAVIDLELRELDKEMDAAKEPMSQAKYAQLHGQRAGLRGAVEAANAIRVIAERVREQQKDKHEDADASGTT